MNGKPNTKTGSRPSHSEHGRITRAARGNPFVDKRARQRAMSLARTLSHVRVPIHAEAHQHRGRGRLPGWLRATVGIIVLLASVGLHVGFIVMAFGVGKLGAQHEKQRERLAIEMREREAEKPKPPEPDKPPEPKREIVERPTVVKSPPAPKIDEPPPKELDKKPPPRIVGLSFESTVGEGNGDGPAFAVGNTRMGETDKVATQKDDVPKQRPAPVHGTEKPTIANQAATRIPVKGVTYTEAKYRGTQVKPDFPPTLKAQGVESDVEVLVFIDATGKVTNVKLLHESPYPEFNEAAKRAALAQEWEPSTRNGEPMASTKKYSYRFRITDE
jgi:periplasmic protein TonB